MTAQEMHIDLDVHLQKINSQVTKNIEPEEKDWLLNEEVTKFIESKLTSSSNIKQIGFENTSKRISDIKDLVREKTLYIEELGEGDKYVSLPDDYFDFVRFDGLVAKNCNQIIKTTAVTKYKTAFSLSLPATDALTIYKIEIYIGGVPTTLFDITDINDLPANYLANESFFKQKFMLTKILRIKLKDKLTTILNSPSDLYWERESFNYSNETFILISNNAVEKITITAGAVAKDFVTQQSTINTYLSTDLPLRTEIRVIDDEFFMDVNNSALSRPSINSLTSVIRQESLMLKIPNSVIIGAVKSTYICKPNLIDLYLNSNLNMSRRVCEEIVRNTAQFIKALITDGNYNAYVRENMLTE
jgi:hypothetical protein